MHKDEGARPGPQQCCLPGWRCTATAVSAAACARREWAQAWLRGLTAGGDGTERGHRAQADSRWPAQWDSWRRRARAL